MDIVERLRVEEEETLLHIEDELRNEMAYISDGKISYSVAESAQFIRKALKAAFPSITFSVRSSSYSGGGHVTVSWFDGPTSKAVEEVCKSFEGSTFDGMQDLRTYHDHVVNGKRVHYGNDSTSCNRRLSPAFVQRVVDAYYEAYPKDRRPRPEVKVQATYDGKEQGYVDLYHEMRDDIMPLCYETDEKELPELRIGLYRGVLRVLHEGMEADKPVILK